MAFSLGKFAAGVGSAAADIGRNEQQGQRDMRMEEIRAQIMAEKQKILANLPTAKQKELESMAETIVGTKNPETGKPFTLEEARQQVTLRAAGFTTKAGTLTANERIAADPQVTQDVAESQGVIEESKSKGKEIGKTEGMEESDRAGVEAGIVGAKTGAELASRIEKEPELAYKLAINKAQAQAEADVAKLGRSNKLAWDTYRKSMDSLSEALGETSTGTFVGLIPAITAKQKTAEGAKAIMAPILKSIFRTAGEGNFTDKDQELLMDMVPKRSDPPETVDAKVRMIDSIVSAKLGMYGDTGASAQTQQFGSEDEEYEALLKRRGLK